MECLNAPEYENVTSTIEDFQQCGSEWVLDKLLALDLHLLAFDPLRATSYIPPPMCIQNNENNDEKCLWSVIAGLYFNDVQLHNLQRPSHYLEYEKEFNLQGILFPMALKDIPKFEKANNVSIFVYGYQEGKEDQEGFKYRLKVSKEVNECCVNLLLIADDNTSHYCFIEVFDKLAGSQYSSCGHKTYFCRFCLHGFSRAYRAQDQHRRTDEEMKERLEEHEERCFAFAAQ